MEERHELDSELYQYVLADPELESWRRLGPALKTAPKTDLARWSMQPRYFPNATQASAQQ